MQQTANVKSVNWQKFDIIDMIYKRTLGDSKHENINHEAQCIIIFQNKAFEWYLATDNGSIEDNEQSFQDFCDFLEDDLDVPNIDIDDINNEVKMFSINAKEDCIHQIVSPDNFGAIFRNFDPSSDLPHVYYFMIKVELSFVII